MAARYKAWTVFAGSNTASVGSNPIQGMNVCVCVYSLFLLLCVLVPALRRADPCPRSPIDCVKTKKKKKTRVNPARPVTADFAIVKFQCIESNHIVDKKWT
jgi:hypothetical protein